MPNSPSSPADGAASDAGGAPLPRAPEAAEAAPSTPPEAAPAPPRPRWHPLARAIVYLAALQAAAVALLFPLAPLWAGPREAALLHYLAAWPLAIGVTVLFLRLLDRRDLASIGARWPAGGWRIAAIQLALASLGVLALIGIWVAGIEAFPDPTADLRFGGLSGEFAASPEWWPWPPGLLLALLLIGFLLQGGFEEWTIRGYVYHTLKARWRPSAAALASSLLFALMHAGNPQVSALALFNILLAGVILAALVERSGSLWSATVAHGVWNFTVACLVSLPVSGIRIFHLLDVGVGGDPRLTGGGFGPEGSLVLGLLGVPLAAVLWWPLRKRPPAGVRRDRSAGEGAPSAPEDGASPASPQDPMDQSLQGGD